MKTCKAEWSDNVEYYTNEDYDKLEQIDFRTIRKLRKPKE